MNHKGGPWSGGQWSVVGGQWSVVGDQWSVVGDQWSVVGDQKWGIQTDVALSQVMESLEVRASMLHLLA
jgi:hypothetical protein